MSKTLGILLIAIATSCQSQAGSSAPIESAFAEQSQKTIGQLCDASKENNCPRQSYCDAPTKKPSKGVCTQVNTAPFSLYLPVPAGEWTYCSKGTRTPNSSHANEHDNTRFAVDLASTSHSAPRLVLASRAGKIAKLGGGCTSIDLSFQEKEDRCQSGWGNFARVQHEDGWFTQYAHLSAILVHDGQQVQAGAVIGIEGNTGAAGAKHIHFSLHRGDPATGPGPSYPMVIETEEGKLNDIQFTCGNWMNNNDAQEASKHTSVLKPLTPQKRTFSFKSSVYGGENPLVLGRWKIHEVPHLVASDRKRAIESLRAVNTPQAKYYLGWALANEGQSQDAMKVFESLAKIQEPDWVRHWAEMRLAMLEAKQGNVDRAKKLIAAPNPEGPSYAEWGEFVATLQQLVGQSEARSP